MATITTEPCSIVKCRGNGRKGVGQQVCNACYMVAGKMPGSWADTIKELNRLDAERNMEVEVKIDPKAIEAITSKLDKITNELGDATIARINIADRLTKLESAPKTQEPSFTEAELNKRYKDLKARVEQVTEGLNMNLNSEVRQLTQKLDTEQASRNKLATDIDERIKEQYALWRLNHEALRVNVENTAALQQQIVRLTDEIVTLKDNKVDVRYHTNKLEEIEKRFAGERKLALEYTDHSIASNAEGEMKIVDRALEKVDALDRSMTEYVNQRSMARKAEINELRRDFELYKQQREPQLPTTGGRMSDIKETLKTDATEAGYRLAGKQLAKLTTEPLAALIARGLGDESEETRAKVGAFLKTDFGKAVASGLLSVGLGTIPGDLAARMSRELRVQAMTDTGDVVADLLMGPLREVASVYLRNLPTEPAALPQEPQQERVSIPAEIVEKVGVK